MLGKDLDVTPMEVFFIMVLSRPESLSGSEIVEKIKENLGLDWTPSPGATYKILQSIDKKGFIEETTKEEDRQDKRIRTYKLTKKGKEILPVITSRILKIALFADSCCSEADIAQGDIKIIKMSKPIEKEEK